MIPVLVSVVSLLAVLACFNLLLSVGLIRRVRDIDDRLTAATAPPPEPMLPVGASIADFETSTVDGRQLSHKDLPDGTLVGFFDPQCETCHSHIRNWVAEAEKLPQGRAQALAVVREDEDQDEMVTPLAAVATVVVEKRRGPMARAFAVAATPAFCRLGADQTIGVHGYTTSTAAGRS